MMRRLFVLLVVPAALLGGCTQVDTGFGEAFRWNNAQQTVNPDPIRHGDQMEGGSGAKAEGAVERYEKGEVTEPVSIQTSVGTTGSGGPR